MAGHNGFRRRIRLLGRRYARRRIPPDAAEERRKRIAARQWICREVREGLVRLGHDPEQCAVLIRGERMIAEELAAPPAPPAPRATVRADPAARFAGKLAALVSQFGDPSQSPPDFGKQSLMTMLAYVLARSPPQAEPAPAAAVGGNRDSDAVG
jgi:hypothetical protein